MAKNDSGWGEMIEKTINFGREDTSSAYKKINPKDSKYDQFEHCSHVMIYALSDSIVIDDFKRKAIILMHMRVDGYIGFPGGVVDPGETPLQAVCRELKEEANWWEAGGAVKESDHQFTLVDEKKQSVYHFYATKISEEKMIEIERNALKASDFGSEVLGHFRVPLHTMGDGFKGFPSFLRNHFSGCCKLQLITALHDLKILTEEQIIQALHSAPLITY